MRLLRAIWRRCSSDLVFPRRQRRNRTCGLRAVLLSADFRARARALFRERHHEEACAPHHKRTRTCNPRGDQCSSPRRHRRERLRFSSSARGQTAQCGYHGTRCGDFFKLRSRQSLLSPCLVARCIFVVWFRQRSQARISLGILMPQRRSGTSGVRRHRGAAH